MIALPVRPQGKSIIKDANGFILARVFPVNDTDNYPAKRDQIIEAVNLHGELVAALYEIYAWAGIGIPEDKGAKCNTYGEAEDKVLAVFRKLEKQP